MLSTLSIDADDVVEDRRKFARCSRAQNYFTHALSARNTAQNGCVDGCVKYLYAHVEDYHSL